MQEMQLPDLYGNLSNNKRTWIPMYCTGAIKPPPNAKFGCFPQHDRDILPSSLLVYAYKGRETVYDSLCCGKITLRCDEGADHYENTKSPRKIEVR